MGFENIEMTIEEKLKIEYNHLCSVIDNFKKVNYEIYSTYHFGYEWAVSDVIKHNNYTYINHILNKIIECMIEDKKILDTQILL